MIAFPECEHCIYRPCYKLYGERKYCLIRFLINEADRRRKEKSHAKD